MCDHVARIVDVNNYVQAIQIFYLYGGARARDDRAESCMGLPGPTA